MDVVEVGVVDFAPNVVAKVKRVGASLLNSSISTLAAGRVRVSVSSILYVSETSLHRAASAAETPPQVLVRRTEATALLVGIRQGTSHSTYVTW